MAFEAFVASGRAKRDRAQRMVGVAVSLALHVPPLILCALQLVVRPRLVERSEAIPQADGSPVVPVRLGARLPQSPTQPALVLPTASEAAVPRQQAAPATTTASRARRTPAAASTRPLAPLEPTPPARPVAQRLALPAGGEVPHQEAPFGRPTALAMLHVVQPEASELERRAAAVRTEILAGLSADPAIPPTLPRSAGPHAAGEGDAHPGPAHELSAGAAAYLRTYENFPSLPDSSWSWRKRTYAFLLQVCVSESGQVDRVIIDRGARPDLDVFLAKAIRTWRYRPWIVSGMARPFCHPLRITYSRG
jgi:hypothetical protein